MSGRPMGWVRLEVQLSPPVAAALKRFAEKVSRDHALSVLYAHLPEELREEQASEIISGFSALEQALGDAGVNSWPWVDTGRPR